jgi:predicted N-formylglutamate amidohydrolase
MSSTIVTADRSHPAREILPGDLASGVIILCDHASNHMPPEYGSLGLPPAALERHIAYDIGAATLSRRLAERLGAPAVLSRFSRLLIDPNRGDDDPTLVMRLSDGAVVPGNARIDAAGIAARQARFSLPYHAAVAALIDRALAAGVVPVLISIHSFTPVMKGIARPWTVSVLWDMDERLNLPLLAALRADPAQYVGDNEPYDGVLEGDTINRHATARGLANTLIEVRQDLITAEADALRWGDYLADVLAPLLGEPDLHHIRRGASRARHRPARAAAPVPEPATMSSHAPLDDATRTALEAAAFRRLLAHLASRTDVQNIDMMNLAGFCRNCLSNWLMEAAAERGVPMDRDASRQHVYGMPYEAWKALHQREATPEQQAAFTASQAAHG